MQYKEVKCLGRWSSYLVQFFFPDYLSKPYEIPVLYIDQNLNGEKMWSLVDLDTVFSNISSFALWAWNSPLTLRFFKELTLFK